MSAAELLGPDGPLARAHRGYEFRASQIEMAEIVERNLEHQGLALIEAGTGTGKTLAYLIPAIRSGQRVIISTGTRTLQDQIMNQDLPGLERVLGIKIRAACMKGVNNYICRRRHQELRHSPEAQVPRVARRLPLIKRFMSETKTGDRAELSELSEHEPIWNLVSSTTETRIGPRCSHNRECYVTAMRKRAEKAQIIVVNHHLFFADLATRGPEGGGILPDYDAVIFDEAHQVEDVATLFFGVQVKRSRLQILGDDLRTSLSRYGLDDGPLARKSDTLSNTADDFFDALPTPALGGARPGSRVEVPGQAFDPVLRARYHALDAALESLELGLRQQEDEVEILAQLGRRCERARNALSQLAEGRTKEQVLWMEGEGDSEALGVSPVEIGGPFRKKVIDRVPTVILTSATLSTGDSFKFIRQRLGIDFEVDEAILASPFDYARQAALYLPDLPDPRAANFGSLAVAEILRLCALTGGGAFVLCTSIRMMRKLCAECRPKLGVPTYMQGEAPKGTLLDRFRKDRDAVLFATQSFWEGVDVPGDALRLVIIDRLPFDVPTDPLVEARCRRLEEAGESAFGRYLLPSAALSLKQAFGRLIRTRQDRGITAILDSRIRKKGYGKVFLKSLPDAARCLDFEAVTAFWESMRAKNMPRLSGEENAAPPRTEAEL